MNLQIEEVCMELNRQKSGRERLMLVEIKQDRTEERYIFQGEKSRAVLRLEEKENLLSGWVHVELENEPFRENDHLALETPVRIELRFLGQPKRMTAMYLHRDWWTRPAFIDHWEEIPKRTQILYLEETESAACLLLMAGENYKTYAAPGREGWLTLEMTAYQAGRSEVKEPVFHLGEGSQIYDAVQTVFEASAEEKALPLRGRRSYPEMFEYLGWCSWDAFYTDITEEKVRKKAEELTEKQVPVRWFLLDDGWLSVHGQKLYDLIPEKEKFPEGFRRMIREIKAKSQIDWFGVWHAFGGYWGGLEPGSKAALEETGYLFETSNGKLLPHPAPEKGYGFFRDWYERLRAEGIDFVKVDGQSAVKNYYENQLPVCWAAKGAHEALEGAASAYMGGRLINCMGMAMENILGRPSSGVTRNSDDFVPENKNGFAEHLLQNCYNAVYQDPIYYCDWDMFWTSHPDAAKHGILRAVSGGPVYFSDRIGETDKKAVEPLVYRDGRILRMDRAAKPSTDCMFCDPQKERILKITNIARYGEQKTGGAVAIYNISGKEEKTVVRAEDIYDLPEGTYYLYDWMKREGIWMKEKEEYHVTLCEDGYGLYLLIPAGEGITPVGLLDKYISFHGIEAVCQEEACCTVVLREGGLFGFAASGRIEGVSVNGKDCTDRMKAENGIWKIDTKTEGKTVVVIKGGTKSNV